MTGRTHLTLGILVGLAASHHFSATPETTLAITVGAALGSLLPDIDCPTSMISGYVPFSELALKLARVSHRTFTHGLIFIFTIAVAWLFATQNGVNIPYPIFLAFIAGICSHLIADMATPKGVPLFYPFGRNWKLAPGVLLSVANGLIEAAVFLAAAAGIVYLLWLHVQRFA